MDAEGYLKIEDDENILIKLCEHFYEQGCREFDIQDGVLYLRWPDGRQQKVIPDAGTSVH